MTPEAYAKRDERAARRPRPAQAPPHIRPLGRPTISDSAIPVHSLQDDNATVVRLAVGWGLEDTGSAKRAPEDTGKDYAKAYRIAVGRAMIKLGHRILKAEHCKGY